MKISLEAECLPLFAAGVLILLVGEVLFAILALRRRPESGDPFWRMFYVLLWRFFAWAGCCLFRSPRRTEMFIIALYCWLFLEFSGSWESAAVCGSW